MRVVTRTEVVENEIEVYRPLPSELTDPLPYPPDLSDRFTEGEFWNSWNIAYDIIKQANKDRATAARISAE